MIYIIGSLKNEQIPVIANRLREEGFDVFDDWYAPGPETDDYWQSYARQRGQSFVEALASPHAQDVFEFDKRYLEAADAVVMVLPCGKSGHLELGWCRGQGKPGYILLPGEPERYDVMYNFATGITADVEELIAWLKSV